MRAVAILETMWGSSTEGAEAPRYFRINHNNHSGRRLYQLLRPDASLLVTNACREYVTNAKQHGKPDPAWLAENLTLIDSWARGIDVLLVCGKIAQKTYKECGYTPKRAKVIEIPHPAARFIWTELLIADIRRQIGLEEAPV